MLGKLLVSTKTNAHPRIKSNPVIGKSSTPISATKSKPPVIFPAKQNVFAGPSTSTSKSSTMSTPPAKPTAKENVVPPVETTAEANVVPWPFKKFSLDYVQAKSLYISTYS